MLYRHADIIMTKKIPTMVVNGGNALAGIMPSPRAVCGGVPAVQLRAPQTFLPLGEESESVMDTLKRPLVLGALAAAVLFLTPIGKNIRKKVGLA